MSIHGPRPQGGEQEEEDQVHQQEDPELILRAPELVEQEEQPQLPEAKTETA